MGTELGGYRQYKKVACTASTQVMDFDPIGEGHKVYIERVAVEADKSAADFEVSVVSGGLVLPFTSYVNVTSDVSHGLNAGVWVYPGEFVRVTGLGLGSSYTIKAWLLGVDKWEKDGT